MAAPAARRRARRRAAYLFALLVLLGVTAIAVHTYRHYTDPQRIRAAAEDYLQQFANGRVTVGGASFSWVDGVRLQDVALNEGPKDGVRGAASNHPVFYCREVRLTGDPWSTVRGPLKIESIVALQPTCMIDFDETSRTTNLAGLLRPTPALRRAGLAALPTVELRGAHIQWQQRNEGGIRATEGMTLTLRGRSASDGLNTYDVVWHGGQGPVLDGHSQIDLRTGSVRSIHGGLPGMSIEAALAVLSATLPGVKPWEGVLVAQGTVRAVDYRWAAPAHGGSWVTMELSDASLSIPVDETEKSSRAEERYLRWNQIAGTVHATGGEVRAELSALFHGSSCRVSAMLRGEMARGGDVQLDATASLVGATLPAWGEADPAPQQRFVRRWPLLARLFRDYDPHGPVDLAMVAMKPPGEHPIRITNAVVTARGGDASCRYAPYRVADLSGSVEYSPEGVAVRDLRGRHGDAHVRVEGRLAAPKRGAAAELLVVGEHLVIDEELRVALPDEYLPMVDRFEPAGKVSAQVSLVRPIREADQPPSRWQTQSVLSLEEVTAVFAPIPYRVDDLVGTLVVQGNEVRVNDVRGRAGDGQICVNGEIVHAAGGVRDVCLEIAGENLPLDERLLAALPESIQAPVRAFDATGRLDLKAQIGFDTATDKPTHNSQITLRDVSMRHNKFAVPITDISGELGVSAERTLFADVAGRYGGARLIASGVVEHGEGGAAEVALSCRDLRFDDALRSSLPAAWRNALVGWEVDGPIGADGVWRNDACSGDDRAKFRAVAALDGVTIGHTSVPLPFRGVRGHVSIDETGVRAEAMEALYSGSNVAAAFRAHQTPEGAEAIITLSATDVALDASMRAGLPRSWREVWDRLDPTGRVDIRLDPLTCRQEGPDHATVWSVDGSIHLHDGALRGTAEVERLNGAVTGGGRLVDSQGAASLSGRLNLSTAAVLGHEVTEVVGQWSFAQPAQAPSRFAIDAAEGRLYDGSLTSELEIISDAMGSDYSLSAAIHRMEIEPFLNADPTTRSPDGEPIDVRGQANAHLYLAGVMGDPSSRRGGGRVEILDARMSRLPIILAILKVINLSIPDREAFDEVRSRFLLVGNRVDMGELVLRSKALALIGSGTMSLPDRTVDLQLVNVSPHRWAQVPVVAELVRGASRELVELQVTGPLSRPTVRARPFRGITDEFKSLFRKRKPSPIEPA